jgi:hypothetical protein
MDDILRNVIFAYEKEVRKLNKSRSSPFENKLKVTVLGQQGLLIRKDKMKNLHLVMTTDFDGNLRGEPPLGDIFKKKLKEFGLTYDEKSQYIWLPDETEYEGIYESDVIFLDSPLPIYLITSKALKAPEKNKQLVISAIEEYGEDLLKLFDKYKVDMTKFI